MKKNIFIFLIFITTQFSNAQPPRAGFTLVWSDDFTGTVVDTAKWSFLDNKTRSADINKTCYQKSNVSQSGGTLKLTANNNGCNCSGTVYSGGMITSKGSCYNNKFGYFEARLRHVCQGPGFWGNFWMNSNEGWPPEFDIAEMISNDSTKINLAYHYYDKANVHQASGSHPVIDWKQWHVYGVEWLDGPKLRFYIDSVMVFESAVSIDYPALEKMCVILRMGAFNSDTWGGTPTASTVYPGYAEYDWVKVWQQTSNPNNQAPNVNLLDPTNHSTFIAPATVDILAGASDYDGKITKVEFYNGDSKIGEATIRPYAFRWKNVNPGNYSITAKAYDNDGAVKTSNTIDFIAKWNDALSDFQSSIDIFPTQSESIITIKNAMGADARIFSLSGLIEQSFKIENENIDISALSPGLYFITINKESQTATKKFIKL